MVCALVITFTATARGNEAGDTQAIKAVYAKHTRAFRAKDIETLISVLTPDCTIKDHGVIVRVPQLKASFSQQANRIQSIKEYREEVTALHVHGKQATAALHVTFAGKVADLQGKVHDVVETGASEDTLIKTPQGEWKIRHSETRAFHVVMDGKTVIQ